MRGIYWLILAAGVMALLYSVLASRSVLAAPSGTDRMREPLTARG